MLAIIYCGLIMSIFCFDKSLAVSDEMKEMAKMLHNACVDETGVDEGMIDKVNTGDFSEDNKLKGFPMSVNNGLFSCINWNFCDEPASLAFFCDVQCYMKCLMEQISGITDDGDIDEDVLVSMLPEEMVADVEPIIRTCGTVKGADLCDTVYQTQKCYYATNPKVYFLF